MKQRIQIVLMVSMIALSILACQVGGIDLGYGETIRGSGNVVEETRTVSDFTGVDLATLGTLHIEVSDRESLRIEAEDNLMEYLETEVSNGRLRIGTQDNVSLRTTRPVHYYLTVIDLDRIMISSSGDIEMGDLKTDTLTVVISSSGDMTMGVLNADMLEVDNHSSGNLDIAGGEVKTQNITIGSSGKYSAQDLASDEAEVHINSSGSATIWVHDHLNANLNSSGDLRYRGNPTVDAATNSSGDVIQIGE